MTATPRWKKSTFSGTAGCVEVAIAEEVLMRDSKNPHNPILTFTKAEWQTFLKGVKAGEFDR